MKLEYTNFHVTWCAATIPEGARVSPPPSAGMAAHSMKGSVRGVWGDISCMTAPIMLLIVLHERRWRVSSVLALHNMHLTLIGRLIPVW